MAQRSPHHQQYHQTEPVGIDMCANGEPLQIHPTTLFYKGISAHSTGLVHYDLTNQPRNFTYVKFTMGMQAFKADGSNSTGFTRIIFMMNGAETGSKRQYARLFQARTRLYISF